MYLPMVIVPYKKHDHLTLVSPVSDLGQFYVRFVLHFLCVWMLKLKLLLFGSVRD